MNLLPFVFRAMHLRPRIDQVLKEATPIAAAFKRASPSLVPALKELRKALVRAYQEAGPVIAAYQKASPTLLPLAQALWWELLPEIAKEFARGQGPAVSPIWVQESLNKLGAKPKLLVDGDMGEATREATRQFQEQWNKDHPEQKLDVDGWVGPATISALYIKVTE